MSTPHAHPVPDWIRPGRLRWVWGLWEPLMFYRRWATMAAYSPGNALWTESWYRRMHSEQHVTALAELGVNCISTHWFKGFGLRAEAEEMRLAAEFTRRCHEHGIRVLGYVQWATICYETFLDECPQAEQWVQRDAEGKKLLYTGNTYWRWLGCQQHEEYFAYLKEVVRRCLEDAKMDGIEWDGTTYACHCPLCQQRFREYLADRYSPERAKELFGLPHFRHVRIPTGENRRDPLRGACHDFRRRFMVRRLAAYNDLVKSINPQAAQATYAQDAAPLEPIRSIDLLMDENHNAPFVADGVLTSKFRGLKHGRAAGRVVLSTAWLRAQSAVVGPCGERFDRQGEPPTFASTAGGLRLPETAAEVKRDLAEPAMFGGHVISPTWATRSTGGDRAAFDNPVLAEPLRAYLDFFRRNEALYDVTESLANVGVLHAHASLALDAANCRPCVMGAEQICLQQHVPFDVVFSFGLEALAKYDALVLAEQTCLSDGEIERLGRFVAGGGGLVVTGRTGLYDEHFRHRAAHPLAGLFAKDRVVYFPDNPERCGEPGDPRPLRGNADLPLPARSAEVAAAILRAAGGRLPYRLDAGPFVGTDAYRLRSGECAIHLLNYANESPAGGITVHVPEELRVSAGQLFTPDAVPSMRTVQAGGPDKGRFVVEGLDTYAVLLLAARGSSASQK